MTAEDFRRLALKLEGAAESAHMQHPDFRVGGKVFATLAYPDEGYGMVKLTPEQQHEIMERSAIAFEPAAGAWGRKGCTLVQLAQAEEAIVLEALTLAWKGASRKTAVKKTAKRSRV